MAPPIRIASTLSMRFTMRSILSDTLAPPRTATYGLSGWSLRRVSAAISPSIRRPAAGVGRWRVIPTTEACARWAVPKASFTYRSAGRAAPALEDEPQRRQRGAHARVVRHGAVLQRHVEIDPHEDRPAADVQVAHGHLAALHGGNPPGGSAPCMWRNRSARRCT